MGTTTHRARAPGERKNQIIKVGLDEIYNKTGADDKVDEMDIINLPDTQAQDREDAREHSTDERWESFPVEPVLIQVWASEKAGGEDTVNEIRERARILLPIIWVVIGIFIVAVLVALTVIGGVNVRAYNQFFDTFICPQLEKATDTATIKSLLELREDIYEQTIQPMINTMMPILASIVGFVTAALGYLVGRQQK
jgi:hypothetical protein